MGTMNLAATSPSSSSSYTTLLFLAVMVGIFYLLILRPQRNRQRKTMQTQNMIMPGQRIRTTGGMYGTVVSGDDRDVVIEISPGVHVTMLRRAIMEVIPDDYGTTAPEDEEPAAAGSYEAAPTEDGRAEDEPGSGHNQSSSLDDWDVKGPELPDDPDGKDHRTEQGNK